MVAAEEMTSSIGEKRAWQQSRSRNSSLRDGGKEGRDPGLISRVCREPNTFLKKNLVVSAQNNFCKIICC